MLQVSAMIIAIFFYQIIKDEPLLSSSHKFDVILLFAAIRRVG